MKKANTGGDGAAAEENALRNVDAKPSRRWPSSRTGRRWRAARRRAPYRGGSGARRAAPRARW